MSSMCGARAGHSLQASLAALSISCAVEAVLLMLAKDLEWAITTDEAIGSFWRASKKAWSSSSSRSSSDSGSAMPGSCRGASPVALSGWGWASASGIATSGSGWAPVVAGTVSSDGSGTVGFGLLAVSADVGGTSGSRLSVVSMLGVGCSGGLEFWVVVSCAWAAGPGSAEALLPVATTGWAGGTTVGGSLWVAVELGSTEALLPGAIGRDIVGAVVAVWAELGSGVTRGRVVGGGCIVVSEVSACSGEAGRLPRLCLVEGMSR